MGIIKKDIIIVDIDGTLADITHRLHFINGNPKNRDWDSFNKEISEDKVKEDILSIVNVFISKGFKIHLKTGRAEEYRKNTEIWLFKNKILYDHLDMRANGDYSSDFQVKQSMLDSMLQTDRDRILCVIDDRQQVVDMWRKNGLTCLQCQKGDY